MDSAEFLAKVMFSAMIVGVGALAVVGSLVNALEGWAEKLIGWVLILCIGVFAISAVGAALAWVWSL